MELHDSFVQHSKENFSRRYVLREVNGQRLQEGPPLLPSRLELNRLQTRQSERRWGDGCEGVMPAEVRKDWVRPLVTVPELQPDGAGTRASILCGLSAFLSLLGSPQRCCFGGCWAGSQASPGCWDRLPASGQTLGERPPWKDHQWKPAFALFFVGDCIHVLICYLNEQINSPFCPLLGASAASWVAEGPGREHKKQFEQAKTADRNFWSIPVGFPKGWLAFPGTAGNRQTLHHIMFPL